MSKVNKPLIYTVIAIVLLLAGSYFYQQATDETQETQETAEKVDFSQYAAGVERKQVFVDYFKPLIEAENIRTLALREKIIQAQDKATKPRWLNKVVNDYRIVPFDEKDPAQWRELLTRVDAVPVSLALAQAANESGWGTSRFARQGNNFYGQWCYTKGCGIVPSSRGAGENHEVAAFDSPRQSVAAYILNINSHPAYTELRAIRAKLREQQPVTGAALAVGLLNYSERREEYVEELRAMIRHNNWARLDLAGPAS